MAWIPLLALQAACLLAGNVISVTLRTCYSRYIRVLIIVEGADATGPKGAFGDQGGDGIEHGVGRQVFVGAHFLNSIHSLYFSSNTFIELYFLCFQAVRVGCDQ
jgi:hypothetical protein